ncbi:MAG: hypothetical protein C5B55_01595 [Blastocatellia bacterium]|nr:MAG: hypothetical protein C5B55_01595 [Blastocatellia bacterium]
MHLLEHSPNLSVEAAADLARVLYGISATARSLPSERDQNFLLTTETTERFVLKIANALEERSLLVAQNALMSYLASRVDFSQRIVKTLTGDELATFNDYFVRLVTYIPGTTLAKIDSSSPEVLRDLGRKLGKLDQILSDFDHPALHRDFHWDLRNGSRIIQQNAPLIHDQYLSDIVRRCAAQVENYDSVAQLRRSIIHGDANDYNVIVEGARVVGLIDFGDAVYSYTVGDLAVALAYVVLDKEEPLQVAAEVVRGYDEVHPLTEDEFSVLFDLMLLRLSMSVCHAAHQQKAQPQNEYLNISQAAIRKKLPELARLDREEAIKTWL